MDDDLFDEPLEDPEVGQKRLPFAEEAALVQRFTKAQQDLVLQASDLSLRTVATMVDGGAIDVAPQFQRRDRWGAEKQSLLIESFVLNIPVPPIYLAEDELGTYSVIDGKQRITAIAAYLSGHLVLRSLKRFPELNGLAFGDLPRPIQHSLDLRPLRSVTLLKQSDPELKYEVFHRLNSGGEILNAQEIRNVIYRGPLNDVVYLLAQDEFLRAQLKITDNKSPAYRSMQDAEYVLRFLTLQDVWPSFSGDLARSMDTFMEANRKLPANRLETLAAKFSRSLRASEQIWHDAAFKRPEGDGWRDQALAGMYDAQMVALAELGDTEVEALVRHAGLAKDAVRELFGDQRFEAAVRQGTNTPNRVKYRISRLRDALANAVRAEKG